MEILESLLTQLKSKKRRQDAIDNLDAIYKTCNKLLQLSHSDFSVSHIARFGEDFGVPKEQSLRNNKDYITLIKAFRRESEASGVSKKRQESRDSWIEEIDNPRLKYLARKLSNDLKRAKQQIDEMKPIDNTITVHDVGSFKLDLLPLERNALNYIASEEFLLNNNFTSGGRGDVIDEGGNEIFKVATQDALKKILMNI